VVLLEAMAAGTSVIASDLSGYRAVARGDNEARLVPPGDVAALRGALRDLLDDPGERERFAKAGSERAEEFSIDHLAERFLPLYERAIRTARAGAGVARPVRLSR
jgi:phosphatidylinositol alpha-mannosyltransferase